MGLRDGQAVQKIELRLLDEQDVRDALAVAGLDPAALSPKQLDLLRTPLHLMLYLEGEPRAHGPFRSEQDLFDRYWQHKRRLVDHRLGYTARWTDVIDRLADELSERQALAVPQDVLDDFAATAEAMTSEHVLLLENGTYRFFHERFFDYAFARRFIQKGGDVIALLVAGRREQHLFRRTQVRQILEYQRGSRRENYLRDLGQLLADDRVRFHIKGVVLGWLGQLDDPSVEEWAVLDGWARDDRRRGHALNAIKNREAWFDALDRAGVWDVWLASANEGVVDLAVRLLALPAVMERRSSRLAQLLGHHRRPGADWERRLRYFVRCGGMHHSREMIDLFLALIDDGTLDASESEEVRSDDLWFALRDMARDRPEEAAEVIGRWLDRSCASAERRDRRRPFGSGINHERSAADVIRNAAEREPAGFLRHLLHRIVAITARHALPDDDGLLRDAVWPRRSFGSDRDARTAILTSAARAMEVQAASDPNALDGLTAGLDASSRETVAFLLLRAWSANGRRYAERAAEFLASVPARLDVGYSSWGYGNGHAAVSRAALGAITAHCSDAALQRLEAAIIGFSPRWERREPESVGFTELLLLRAIEPSRLSERSRSRIAELHAKFPGVDLSPPRPAEAHRRAPPSPTPEVERMTDDQWTTALRESRIDGVRVDEETLASLLKTQVERDRGRFAALVVRLGDDVPPIHFSTILNALMGDVLPLDRRGDTPARQPESVDVGAIVVVVRRMHVLPGSPCGQSILGAIEKMVEHPLPGDLLDVVSHYAMHDPEPAHETWQTRDPGGSPHYGGNLHGIGINTVRGRAADVIARLLFADRGRLPGLEAALLSLARDPSMAVRTCAIESLLALFNVDVDRSIELFLDLAEGTEAIHGIEVFEQFLHYAVHVRYGRVRPLLQSMLASGDERVVKTAARQTCLAGFDGGQAAEDAAAVRVGTDTMRAAAASIYATNLRVAAVVDECREHLPKFFADPVETVGEEAASCFQQLSGEDLRTHTSLVNIFLESPAFKF